jgi:hypothetical protein
MPSELADRIKHLGTMALDVRDVLNAFFHGSQGFAQCRFALAERAPPQISSIVH